MHPHHISGKASLLLCSKERAKGGKEGRKERKIWHTLLALGTSSCNAFILSAILSLRSCNKRVASVSEKTQLKLKVYETDRQRPKTVRQTQLISDSNLCCS
jgi:hypothetical protein